MFPLYTYANRLSPAEPTTYANRKARLGLTSIADQAHKHERANARRMNQAERNARRLAESGRGRLMPESLLLQLTNCLGH